MKYIKKIIGDRIYLSPKGVSEEEIEKYTKWLNDFKVTDYTGRSGYIQTFLNERDYLENLSKRNDKIDLNIIDINNDKLIGTIGLANFNFTERSAVLGIFIGDKDYRGKGYGSEAVNLMLEYGFKYINLHSIRLELMSENERAHKCYLKCGFKDTGRNRELTFINGKYYDILYMDILENEFKGDYIRNKNI